MFEMGPDRGIPEQREPNKYPAEKAIPGFEDFTKAFYWDAYELSMNVLRSIAVGLGLEDEYFVDYHKDADNLFRLAHYPAVERASLVQGSAARASPHTDYGTITLLVSVLLFLGKRVDDYTNIACLLSSKTMSEAWRFKM